ncbi:quinon protein alcohol dehydrogenase-like superfamily, partial [Earliella scabrosa]
LEPVIQQAFAPLYELGTCGIEYSTDIRCGAAEAVTCFAISADSTYAASGSYDGLVTLWHVRTKAKLNQWFTPGSIVSCLAFSPTERTSLMSCGDVPSIFIRNVALNDSEQEPSVTLHSQRASIISFCAWSPDGTLAVTRGGSRATPNVWDVITSHCLFSLPQKPGLMFRTVLFSQDGSHLMSHTKPSHEFGIWDTATGLLLRNHSAVLGDVVVFSPDTQRIATISLSKKVVHIWNSKTCTPQVIIRAPSMSRAVFSADRRRLLLFGITSSTMVIHDAIFGWKLISLEGHSGGIYDACFSPNGTHIASGSYDRTVRLWNVVNGTLVRTFSEHRGEVLGVHFSPDSNHLLSYASDGSVYIRSITL